MISFNFALFTNCVSSIFWGEENEKKNNFDMNSKKKHSHHDKFQFRLIHKLYLHMRFQ